MMTSTGPAGIIDGSRGHYAAVSIAGVSLEDRIKWQFKVQFSTFSGPVLNRISGISNFER